MIGAHLRDRFFQSYGEELTVPVLRELVALAHAATGVPDAMPGREKVTVLWRGHSVRIVWSRAHSCFITFLPPQDRAQRIALPAMKRRRRR